MIQSATTEGFPSNANAESMETVSDTQREDSQSVPMEEEVGVMERALSTSTVTSADSAESPGFDREEVAEEPKLSFRSGIAFIPHPEKLGKGGEDAYFVQDGALGVFDGVGGWASIGVDAGLYSKELARLTSAHMTKHGPASAVDALRLATKNNQAIGSSTACVVGLVGNRLVGVNLGDSGLIVIRGWDVIYRAHDQQHYFNCPFQLGTDSMDTVDVGAPIEVELRRGDCVVIGTDGLWDNVFAKEVVDVVSDHIRPSASSDTAFSASTAPMTPKVQTEHDDGDFNMSSDSQTDDTSTISESRTADDFEKNARAIAKSLADTAIRVANDERARSPFAVNAQNAGHSFFGGKVDDITIIAALVVEGSSCTGHVMNIVNGEREKAASDGARPLGEPVLVYEG